LNKGDAMAIGGCSGACSSTSQHGNSLNAVRQSAEIYHYATNTWTLTANMNTGRAGAVAAAVLADNRVLVCGGQDGFSTIYRTCEIYDPAANTWTNTGTQLSGPRWVSQSMILLNDGRVLSLFGGDSPTVQTQVWTPATGLWTTVGSLSSLQADGGIALLPNGEVLVAGGWNGLGGSSNDCVNTAQIFSPITNTWRNTGSMSAKRCPSQSPFLPVM